MDLELQGKVAVITGASEGIGKATSRMLASEGAHVVMCARRQDLLESVADSIREQTGGSVLAVAGDVRRGEDVERLINQAVEKFGGLNILINNAGTSAAHPFDTVDDAAWQNDLDLKLFAAIRSIRLAVPHMRTAGGGAIVNMLNTGAKAPAAASTPTSVTRAAGLALTKALSKELAEDNIRVNAVLIGLIKSGQHERRAATRGIPPDQLYEEEATKRGLPLGRYGEAEEAADLVVFLSSARSSYITGVAINMDGGVSPVV
ncbi:MAG TPA: SDR family oxidoreductase [Chloroflexota bacterium]|jgi:NAD(P)-dependent dehydrogenase (short-subunit alcohol dehydrogenase family)|nr:SDR family oxidoreductase [Chloroflexota bacterium]